MTTIGFTLNGEPVTADVLPRTHLGDFLRDRLRLSGTHLGCEHGVCGACTVLLNGAPARSCSVLAVACDGMDVKTIESFDDDPVMSDLRDAFTEKHGLQCGFCTPGVLITSRDIVLRIPNADDTRIRVELAGNLCRCTGYAGIVDAVAAVLEKRKSNHDTVASDVTRPFATPALPKFEPNVETRKKPPVMRTSSGEQAPQGWTRFEQSFTVARPRAQVWYLFNDIPRVAACLPGAQVLSQEGRTIKGRMTTKLGPISASFTGSAAIERDDANYTGSIVGAGSDSASGSRTKGEVKYRLMPLNDDTKTLVEVVVLYSLQGSLAQFSRSGLAQEFGRQLVQQFAYNLGAQFGEEAIKAGPTSLNVGALIWSSVKGWLARPWSK